MKRWLGILLITACLATACNKNQLPQETVAVEQVISSKDYVFRAQTANPAGGSAVRLSYGYDLIVKPGSIVATLPYYGRAYVADRNFGGIRFNSTKFRYEAKALADGGWDIVIEPEDAYGIESLRLAVSADGYATLYVTSTNRQAISYYGQVQRP